jgi:hypothetical protein
VIVDFFSQLPESDQKWWKRKLAAASSSESAGGGGGDDLSGGESDFPQMETQLKLLYTAVTRCCNRLVFVETRKTPAGSAFFRWLADRQLAEQLYIDPAGADGAAGGAAGDAGGGEVFMSNDEWRVRGIDFALAADGSNAIFLLRNAVKCFDRAGVLAKGLRDRAAASEQFEILKNKIMQAAYLSTTISSALEAETSENICRCIKLQLLHEAHELCELIAPYFANKYQGKLFYNDISTKLGDICGKNKN